MDPTPPNTMGAAGTGALGPGFWLPPMLLDAGQSSGSNEPACGVQVVPAQRRRLDMYIMLDSNITLPATGVWEKITTGLGQFVSDPLSRGIGVGIRYFGLTCNPQDYENASIEIDLLPANASSILGSIKSRPPWSASPMLAALKGGLTHQRVRARIHPDWKQVVVLVSDGFTQDVTCLYSTQDLADEASNGYQGFPSIETHVIGVGVTTSFNDQLDEFLTRLGAFNAIAQAGGSREAITTGITSDAAAFSAALQQVRRNASPCEFRGPAGLASSEFGVARFPVAEELPRVGSEAECGDKQAWYYAVESLPTPVTMCPATCDWLREADDHQIGLLLGCSTGTR